MRGKLDDEKLGAAVEMLQAATTKYPAQGAIISAVFFVQVTFDITDGKRFQGNGGGAFTPGGGALWGDVYTDDIDRLYREAKSFSVIATNAYVNVMIYDSSSNLLGHLEAGAVSTVTGFGGGTGGWS
jgi:hypothetical protein